MKNISLETLLTNLKTAVEQERACTMKVIEYLDEVNHQKIHLKMGYHSLHEFTVKELGYSDSAAYRRIQALRLTIDIPSAKEKLATGTLSLSNAAKLSSFLQISKKQNTTYSISQKQEMVLKIS